MIPGVKVKFSITGCYKQNQKKKKTLCDRLLFFFKPAIKVKCMVFTPKEDCDVTSVSCEINCYLTTTLQ